MSEMKRGRILMTGAAGGVGTFLRAGLAEAGWQVRGFDLVTPDEPDATEWLVGDVGDAAALDAAMRDVDVVVHLAGIPVEDTFARILKSNIDGTYQVFDAAVRAGVPRILTASSNHAVGYYERADFRDAPIGVDVRPRPDTYYGVSKVFGEAIGSFYHDRHGLQVACVRIGSCFEEPKSRRMLDTWLSPADATRLFDALATAPDLGYEIVYGISANKTAWWDLEPARRLGYEPQDDSDVFAEKVEAAEDRAPDPEDPEYRYLGGRFTTFVPPED
ncbi:NAD-dependent epimerase/dehydratase family protein [Catenulispora rubra]|uniref:NAD-dependent epimerase/dehydratase family protein n=1 Tax=Catenulispora rubra TaxID=280293 RepID=UPI001E5FC202|nr:NAD(P)-dependent oxidoreductase [Catenulispora rubra]